MTGILLINLGTPQSPTAKDVGKYLREFLMDPYVIDIPFLWRWVLVNLIIVPKRSSVSARQYASVWTHHGSPLLAYSISLCEKVQNELPSDYTVRLGMRYGEPSILNALKALKSVNPARLVVLPLYPQYSLAAFESSIQETNRCLQQLQWKVPVTFIPAFYADKKFIGAQLTVSREALRNTEFDLALFSFHGLPERQIKKTDPTGFCAFSETCCAQLTEQNKNCYRAQSFATARSIAEGLNIKKYQVCFQSRLGRTPWIKPYTDEFYRTLPAQGIKDIVVFCPSFVADCLETLEEVCIRGKEEFLRHGGKSLTLIPSLNDHPAWVSAVHQMTTNLEHTQK